MKARYLPPLLLLLLAHLTAAAQLPFFPAGVPSVTANPPAPWAPGQRVDFEITVSRFRAIALDPNGNPQYIQFFHGLGLEWADCWTDVQLGAPPPVRYTEEGFGGQWLAMPQGGPPSRCKGGRSFPGFYFDGERTVGDARVPLDGDPGNNYGDGLRNLNSHGSWTFRWSARVNECPGTACSFAFGVYVLCDGETGSWPETPPGCAQGVQPRIGAASGSLTGAALRADGPFCVGQSIEVYCTGDAQAPRVRWLAPEADVELEESCRLRLRWNERGAKLVLRQRLDAQGRLICTDSLRIEMAPPPDGRFVLEKDRVCARDEMTVELADSSQRDLNYRWRLEPDGIVIQNQDTAKARLRWLTSGVKQVILDVFDETCGVWAASPQEVLVDEPISTLGVQTSQPVICQGQSIVVSAIAQTGAELDFSFPNADIPSGKGHGPHQVRYPQPGGNVILLNATYGACHRLAVAFVHVYTNFELDAPESVVYCEPTAVRISAALHFSGEVFPWPVYPANITWTPSNDLSRSDTLVVFASPETTTTYTLVVENRACRAEAEIQVKFNPRIIVTGLARSYDRCSFKDAITLNAEAAGGTPPYTYEWEPKTNLSNPYSPGTKAWPEKETLYRLWVQDSLGCRGYAETVVKPRFVDILGFDEYYRRCGPQDAPVELVLEVPAGANYEYQWLPPDGLSCSDCRNPTVLDTTSRSYHVIVTDPSSGCQSRVGPFNVLFIQRLQAEAGPDAIICERAAVRLGGRNSQPLSVEYGWEPSAGLDDPEAERPMASPSRTTTYTLTVKADSCPPLRDTVRVVVRPRPEFRYERDELRICHGDSTRLRLLGALNEPGLRLRWIPATGLSSDTSSAPWASPDTTTEYRVELLGVECPFDSLDNILVRVDPLPDFTIGVDSLLICPGEGGPGVELPVWLNDSRAYSYRWNPPAGLSSPFTLTPTARPPAPVVYNLTVTEPATGCQRQDSIWVGVGPNVVAGASWSDTLLCRGDSALIVATGGVGSARYSWEPAELTSCTPCDTLYLKPDSTTTFTVTAEEGNCTSTATVRVRVVPRPVINFQPAPEKGCAPLSVTMAEYGQDIRSWLWDFGDGTLGFGPNPQHVYREPGRYLVRLTATGADSACVLLTDRTLQRWVEVFDRPLAGIVTSADDSLFTDGPPVRLRATAGENIHSCSWDFGDGSYAEGCDVWHAWRTAGEVVARLRVSSESGCVDTASVNFTIWEAELSDLPNVFTPNGDGVNDVWRPLIRTGQAAELKVFDRQGRLVYEGQTGWDGRLPNGKEAPTGSFNYLLRWNGRVYRGWVALLR